MVHQLHARPVLTGREREIAELEALVLDGASGDSGFTRHVGLHGLGGAGKTALALELGYRLQKRCPGAQLFVELRGADEDRRPPLTPREVMRRIIHSFYPGAELPEDEQALAGIYRGVLSDAGEALLVLDDAAGTRQVAPLLPPPNCLLIVTSRARLDLPDFAIRRLDCLEPDMSRKLLLERTNHRLGDLADDAARLCGHLPLALQAFAGIANLEPSRTAAEIVERLRQHRVQLGSVEAAFEVSHDLLAEPMRRRWTILSVFTANFTKQAVMAVWADTEEDAQTVLDHLICGNLVEWDETTRRCRLHDLVRHFCARKLRPSDIEAARARLVRHYIGVGREANDLYLRGGHAVRVGLELFDRERKHLETAFGYLTERSDNAAAEELIRLVDAVAAITPIRFDPRERILWSEAQRGAAHQTGQRAAEGSALGSLGIIHAELGRASEAATFCQQALDIAREVGDQRAEANALGNLGSAHAALSEPNQAIKYYEQQLAVVRAIGDRHGEGNALGNLGIAYADIGEVRRQIELCQQALDIAREVGDRRAEANALGSLGSAHAALNMPAKASEFYEKQLRIACQIGDQRGEGNALGNLGIVHEIFGDPVKASEYYKKALDFDRKVGDQRGEGADLGNLGRAYAAMGNVHLAIRFHKRRLDIAREIGDRRGEGNALGNLGVMYVTLGEKRKARGLFEQQLSIAHDISDRQGEGNATWNLAVLFRELDEQSAALEHAERASEIFSEIESPRAAEAQATLARWRSA